MKPKTVVTTGEIATHCQVTSVAVINWIESGKLRAYTTPGGHRRVFIDHFRSFLQVHGMPPFTVGQPAKRKILVVDDEPDMVRTVIKLLSRLGDYEIATAADGFGAGLQVERICPDLVILDLMMPQLDGFQVCKMIKSIPETEHIKVLVLTGYASEGNVRKALECGADACIGKPLRGEELRDKVEELLRSKQSVTLRA